VASKGLHITEGVAGVYLYHLSEVGTNARSLCGAQTMNTQIPVASWGVRGYLKESGASSARRPVQMRSAAQAWKWQPTKSENALEEDYE
jgi:hypothetical protein